MPHIRAANAFFELAPEFLVVAAPSDIAALAELFLKTCAVEANEVR